MSHKFIRPKKTLSEFNNISDLDQMKKNSIKKGDLEYAKLIQKRIHEILLEGSFDIDSRFEAIIIAYEKILEDQKQKKTRATRTRNKWVKDGTVKTASDLIRKKSSLGFEILKNINELRLSIEQFVIDFASHFDKDLVLLAKAKLANHA